MGANGKKKVYDRSAKIRLNGIKIPETLIH